MTAFPTVFAITGALVHACQTPSPWDSVAGCIGLACITEALRCSVLPWIAWLPVFPTLVVFVITICVRLSQHAAIL